ncbi:MAG: hypothetical protein GY793_03900 [Proteobacteria bacterium]|nr:hypothetical protein [Pseudomonadota bacterium]
MSISKLSNSFKIIRRPDYAKEQGDSSIKVEISNNSNLNNSLFNDLLVKEEPKKKKEKRKLVNKTEKKVSDKGKNDSDINSITSETDFYI